MTDNQKLFAKYLEILEIEKDPPSLELLRKIVKSHLKKIPFENISKLLYKKKGMLDIPDLQLYLSGIKKHHFGGTCYSINYYLYLLLEYLGFNIKLCGADMRNPDVHLISMVNVEDKEFIVDCGYAAPFLEPLPRDLPEDFVINFGDEKYILKPQNKDGTSKVEQFYKEELKHWYTAKPKARHNNEFKKVVKDSYDDNALFMNALLITKFSDKYSVSIRNLSITEISDEKVLIRKITKVDIPTLANEKFGMPEDLVAETISGLESLKDIYS
jgi:N-hydroxyarylamine O-acetyltransferase